MAIAFRTCLLALALTFLTSTALGQSTPPNPTAMAQPVTPEQTTTVAVPEQPDNDDEPAASPRQKILTALYMLQLIAQSSR